MENQFQTSASLLWIPVIAFLALGITYLMYFLNSQNINLSKSQRFILAGLRLLTLFVIGFLLIIPFVKTLNTRTLKPYLVIAQDQSQSLLFNKDSIFYLKSFPIQMNQMIQSLDSKFEVKLVGFGEKIDSVDWKYQQNETNFENLFAEIKWLDEIKKIDVMILASDGIVNRGLSAHYAATDFSFPIYTVALGDTQKYEDIEIKKLDYNKVAFKGNRFPLTVSVMAHHFEGNTAEVEVYHKERIIGSQQIVVDSKNYFKKVYFYISADSSGNTEYSVKIKSSTPEKNLNNNSKLFYVEVNEKSKEILFLFNGYHPDIAVFQHQLESNPAFKLTKKQGLNIPDSVNKYDLIILHQLPSLSNEKNTIFNQLLQSGKPILYILGQQSSLLELNQLNSNFRFENNKNLFNEALPIINTNFNLFSKTFDERQIEKFPPLVVPFGDIREPLNGYCLFNQKIEKITTTKPLWYFNEQNQIKYGVIAGEGIWQWYLEEFKQNGDHSITNELIIKTIQYLTTNKQLEPLVIEIPQITDVQKNIEVLAKLYNASNELITEPDLYFELHDGLGNIYPYQFHQLNNSYYLDLGSLAEGKYQFVSKTRIGERTITQSGTFYVKESTLEKSDLTANHLLLTRISAEHQGSMCYPNQMDSLANLILNSREFKPKIITEKVFLEIIQFKWIFILLLLTLALEWFLRKFWGVL